MSSIVPCRSMSSPFCKLYGIVLKSAFFYLLIMDECKLVAISDDKIQSSDHFIKGFILLREEIPQLAPKKLTQSFLFILFFSSIERKFFLLHVDICDRLAANAIVSGSKCNCFYGDDLEIRKCSCDHYMSWFSWLCRKYLILKEVLIWT